MALSETTLSVRFSAGVDTKSAQATVQAPKLLTLENCVFSRGTSLIKRNGYESRSLAVDVGGTMTGASRLARRGDELLAFTPNRCYVNQADANLWLDAGPAFSVVGSDKPGPHTGGQQTNGDQATLSGIAVHAWEDSQGGVWWQASDADTGRVCRGPEQLDAQGSSPRCVPCGSVIHVYWAVASSGFLKIAVINPVAPSAAATPLLLVDDFNGSNPSYDVCATDRSGTPTLIAWAVQGTTNYRVGFVDASGVLGGPTTGHPSAYYANVTLTAGSPISVAYRAGGSGSSDEFAVTSVRIDTLADFYSTPGSVITSTSAGNPIYADPISVKRIATAFGMAETDGSYRLWGAFEEDDAAPSKHYTQVAWITYTGLNHGATAIRSVGLCARAFSYNGDVFAGFVHDTTYFNTYFVLRLSDFVCVGRLLPGSATGLPTRATLPTIQLTGAVATLCLSTRARLKSANLDKFGETGLRSITLDFGSDSSHQTAQLGHGLYMAGACPSHYDGTKWREQGFHIGPELISGVSATGGSMTSSVKYEYVVWYEWTDALGEIHRGPTSVPFVITMGGSDTQVTLTLPTLRLTQKTNVRICVARSKGNDASAFYRVTSLDPTQSGAAANGYVANDATVDAKTVIDRLDDTTLANQEPLYTNGGVLSNDPVGLGSAITTGKNRLFWTDPSDPNIIRYSRELASGYGVEVAPENQLKCDPYGGDIVALAVMDDNVIVFKEHAPYEFSGDGPLPNGDSANTGFTNPQLITADVGCTDIASIALTPQGTVFKSAKGIYMLGRDHNVSYIGAPVESFNGQTVRRATLMEDRTQVLFLTDSGKSLLYDYFFQQWSTYTNHQGYDAAIVNGKYHYIRTDGRVFRETPGVYSDDGVRIPIRIDTAWLHFVGHLQGLQAFWYVHILGERKSAHQLQCYARTEYSGQWAGPAVFDATGLTSQSGWLSGTGVNWNGNVDPTIAGTNYGDGTYGTGQYGETAIGPYQWRFHLGLEGQAVQLRFEDFEAAGTFGACFELTEIVLTGGVIANTTRPTGAQRQL